ncbi:MAG: magnesium transporter CorA family protein [Liquorilactobacillus hordei]|uniref:magnesium transporter CorA family protein n=1 Tax=Liquorilactobacillus hordei TaxID=468911 RepID=UPI0039EA5705
MIIKHIIEGKRNSFTWFDVCDINESDKNVLIENHELNPRHIAYATDQHERARYDQQGNINILIYNLPVKKDDTVNSFVLEPITFLIKKNTVFTFRSKALEIDAQKIITKATCYDASIRTLIFTILYQISIYYQNAIDVLNQTRDYYLSNLHKISNQNLIQLSNVERSLVYLASGIKTNLLVLEKITENQNSRKLSQTEKKLLHNIVIEVHQAEQTVEIALEVTERISTTSNNLLNNNLNDVMRFLTVWSLVLTIPTIITGFYGMNVALPFAKGSIAWVNITIATIIMIIILVIFFKIRKLF